MTKTQLQGYRGSSTLKKVNTQIQWTPELVQEFIKCSKDPIYFAETHMKIVNVDKGLITIPLYDYQKEIITTVLNDRFTVAECSRQSGKFLFLDKPLPLFNGGFTTMGQVQVGDVLIDADGKPTTVTFKSDIINRPCYRIYFDDGSSCDAGDEHQWEVYNRLNKHKKQILTTEQMYKLGWKKQQKTSKYTEYKWYIPTTKPVDYQARPVKIDPYILGVWLGDGTSATNELTCDIHDVKHYQQQSIIFGKRRIYDNRPNLYTAKIEQLTNETLKFYNLRNNKHIPDDFLYGSIDQRINLVQGLWDTDGFINKSGECSIQLTVKNMRLIEDIYQLLCSLGLRVRKSDHVDKKQNKRSIRLSFTADKQHFCVARIQRKASRQKVLAKRRRYSLSRTIQNIEPIETRPAQCISVDNPRRLYLCGKEYLPTHNTTSIAAFVLWYIIFNENKTVAILANKADTAREILSRIQLAYEHLPKWLQQGVIEWNKGSFELENGSKVLAAATSSNNIRGYTINLLCLDECVTGDTMITVRSKKTGKVSQIPIKALYEYKYNKQLYRSIHGKRSNKNIV